MSAPGTGGAADVVLSHRDLRRALHLRRVRIGICSRARARPSGEGLAEVGGLDPIPAIPYLRDMAPRIYYRRWQVWLRDERIGEVLAATEKAACLRAIQRFKVSREDQQELSVQRAREAP
jgi:hypothetical protein